MKKIYSLLLLLPFIVSCHGQDTTRKVGIDRTYNPEGDIVSSALKDKTGNIWFAASGRGVYRYDGKSFTHFDGLSDNMIKCMLEDKAGNIWIGTRDNGVDRYDGKSITNFSENDGLCSNGIECILEDKNGNIWFGSDFTGGGTKRGDACFYNGKSFTNVTANDILTEKGSMPYTVMTIAEDNKSNLWFGSRGGLLLRYDGKSLTNFSDELK